MLTNIHENPKNCTRLYMNRYPFFKFIRAGKQSKAVNCYRQHSRRGVCRAPYSNFIPLSYWGALSSHTNTWPRPAPAWLLVPQTNRKKKYEEHCTPRYVFSSLSPQSLEHKYTDITNPRREYILGGIKGREESYTQLLFLLS